MVKQNQKASVSPIPSEQSGSAGRGAYGSDTPAEEETAAIIAVLSLMQREATREATGPRTSAWARAGRREAVRPWTGKE